MKAKRECADKTNPIRGKKLNGTNIYCYCIIKKSNDISGAVPKVIIESITGIDSSCKLYSISYKDMAMVVSRVSQDEFSENKLNEVIEDMMWLRKYAVRHEEIVETLMKRYSPLLPMKFCTIYKDEAHIKMILEDRYPEFAETLKFFKDKDEYGVKVYVERDVFKKKMGTEGTVPKAAEAEDNDISGRNYLLRRKIEKKNQEVLITEMSSRGNNIHSIISEWATMSVSNKIVNIGNKTKDEILVHNTSYLVDNKYLDRFYHTIKQLNNNYVHEGFRLVTSGPWPPYNFVSSALAL